MKNLKASKTNTKIQKKNKTTSIQKGLPAASRGPEGGGGKPCTNKFVRRPGRRRRARARGGASPVLINWFGARAAGGGPGPGGASPVLINLFGAYPNKWFSQGVGWGNGKHPQFGYIQAHTQTICILQGVGWGNTEHPQYSYIPKHPQFGYIQAHTQTIGIFRGGGVGDTKHPQYSYIQAHTPTIGISEREIPNTLSIRIFRHIPQQLVFPKGEIPNTRSIRIFRHIPQQLVFPNGKYQIPAVFVYSGTYPTIGISEGEIPNTRSFGIYKQTPKQLVFPRGTKYPQYSYIQAKTKHFVFQGGIPNTRSIRIFRNRSNTWYFRGETPNTRSIRIFRKRPNTCSRGSLICPKTVNKQHCGKQCIHLMCWVLDIVMLTRRLWEERPVGSTR